MLKTYSTIGLIAASIAVFSSAPVRAASAIAENAQGEIYYCTRSDVNTARSCVLVYCQNDSGGQCDLLATNDSSGYAAVAKSKSRNGWAMGYNSQRAANQAALNNCAQYAPANEICRIVLEYVDKTAGSPRPFCVNPASGLPIVVGPCGVGGIDGQGNPWGVKLR
jgi:Domain of unknown function (DUF4189)